MSNGKFLLVEGRYEIVNISNEYERYKKSAFPSNGNALLNPIYEIKY